MALPPVDALRLLLSGRSSAYSPNSISGQQPQEQRSLHEIEMSERLLEMLTSAVSPDSPEASARASLFSALTGGASIGGGGSGGGGGGASAAAAAASASAEHEANAIASRRPGTTVALRPLPPGWVMRRRKEDDRSAQFLLHTV